MPEEKRGKSGKRCVCNKQSVYRKKNCYPTSSDGCFCADRQGDSSGWDHYPPHCEDNSHNYQQFTITCSVSMHTETKAHACTLQNSFKIEHIHMHAFTFAYRRYRREKFSQCIYFLTYWICPLCDSDSWHWNRYVAYWLELQRWSLTEACIPHLFSAFMPADANCHQDADASQINILSIMQHRLWELIV